MSTVTNSYYSTYNRTVVLLYNGQETLNSSMGDKYEHQDMKARFRGMIGPLKKNKILHQPSEDIAYCTVYRAVGGVPEQNMQKVLQLMHGVDKIVGTHDVVVIKPNVQWWNHGTPNLSALKTFIDMIMNRPGGFYGEVVLAENCHRGATPWTSMYSGWARAFDWNSDLTEIHNFNGLSSLLKKRYGDKFSTCHWIDIDSGGRRVFSPSDGAGYIYCDGSGGVPLISYNNKALGEDHRAVIMSYPVFRTDSGTMIDFKDGIWEKGAYTDQPLRFINFAALNHHSVYCGATSSVKNYLGIGDLSGGPDPYDNGRLTQSYYNFHSFPFDKWAAGPKPGMLGAEIGVFMNTIRKADLNFITAEWVGLVSRTEPPIAQTRVIITCTDPVALDYHASKYILYPNSKLSIHNPDDTKSPLHQYLLKCAEEGGGVFDERKVAVISYNFKTRTLQNDNNLVVRGEKRWGSDFKNIMKYFYLRFYR